LRYDPLVAIGRTFSPEHLRDVIDRYRSRSLDNQKLQKGAPFAAPEFPFCEGQTRARDGKRSE
jgi:hypothetical protein